MNPQTADPADSSFTSARPRSGRLAALERLLVSANQWLIVALMATTAVLVFVNVVSRYAFGKSFIWVEELTQYGMIWVTYLGAGLALREGRHVAVDTLQDLLPARVRHLLRSAIALAMAAFLLAVCVLGVQIAMFTWNQESPVLGVPAGLPYLAIPVGAAACLLHLVMFWRSFVERRFERPEELGLEGSE